MSWLLGNRYTQPQDFSQYVPPPASGGGGGGGSDDGPPAKGPPKTQMDAYRFDSSALERAAAAAKELEKSGITTFQLSFPCNRYHHYVRLRKPTELDIFGLGIFQ